MPNISATSELTVSRNGKTLVFTPTEFKKGDNKKNGVKYPGLEITAENLQDYIEWAGEEDFLGMVNSRVSQILQSVFYASIQDGKVDWSADDNSSMLEKLSTRGETKAVLEEKLKRLREELFELTPIMMDQTNTEHMKAMLRFSAIVGETKKLADAIESKKRVKTSEDDDESVPTQA
jgi:hypothetical protein